MIISMNMLKKELKKDTNGPDTFLGVSKVLGGMKVNANATMMYIASLVAPALFLGLTITQLFLQYRNCVPTFSSSDAVITSTWLLFAYLVLHYFMHLVLVTLPITALMAWNDPAIHLSAIHWFILQNGGHLALFGVATTVEFLLLVKLA